jgi:hypothetical protein
MEVAREELMPREAATVALAPMEELVPRETAREELVPREAARVALVPREVARVALVPRKARRVALRPREVSREELSLDLSPQMKTPATSVSLSANLEAREEAREAIPARRLVDTSVTTLRVERREADTPLHLTRLLFPLLRTRTLGPREDPREARKYMWNQSDMPHLRSLAAVGCEYYSHYVPTCEPADDFSVTVSQFVCDTTSFLNRMFSFDW